MKILEYTSWEKKGKILVDNSNNIGQIFPFLSHGEYPWILILNFTVFMIFVSWKNKTRKISPDNLKNSATVPSGSRSQQCRLAPIGAPGAAGAESANSRNVAIYSKVGRRADVLVLYTTESLFFNPINVFFYIHLRSELVCSQQSV